MRRLAAIVALLAVACGRAPDAADAPVRLRVVVQPYLVFAPLHVAQAEGIFSAYGLDVELVPMAGSEQAIPLLIDGGIDVLPGHPAPGLLNAMARGERIRMVAQRSRSAPARCSSLALIARPGLLAGARPADEAPRIRRISVDRQAAMVFFIEEALASVHVGLDTLERAYVPHAAEPDALASAAIDVALAGEPFLHRTIAAGKAEEWIGVEDVLPGIEFSVLMFGERLLDREREAGARFVAAYLEANRRLAAGKTARNLALVGEFLDEEPGALEGMCWPFEATTGRVRVDHLTRFQEWAHRHGWIDRIASEDELIDGAFVERASQILNEKP
jgi:ABC-type nitrate/sulfonate/bicarbonate transport system substrate-binding protein